MWAEWPLIACALALALARAACATLASDGDGTGYRLNNGHDSLIPAPRRHRGYHGASQLGRTYCVNGSQDDVDHCLGGRRHVSFPQVPPKFVEGTGNLTVCGGWERPQCLLEAESS
jgi:hypothetical protein